MTEAVPPAPHDGACAGPLYQMNDIGSIKLLSGVQGLHLMAIARSASVDSMSQSDRGVLQNRIAIRPYVYRLRNFDGELAADPPCKAATPGPDRPKNGGPQKNGVRGEPSGPLRPYSRDGHWRADLSQTGKALGEPQFPGTAPGIVPTRGGAANTAAAPALP
jgi:hypothetical protein